MTSGRETPAGLVPAWLRELAAAAETMETSPQLVPPATGGRASAVLVLFGDGPGGPDLLLIQRSEELRLHAGQPAFPGGAIDAGDGGPVGAALREAVEEVGLDPSGVDVVGHLARGISSRGRASGSFLSWPGGGGRLRSPQSTRARWRR